MGIVLATAAATPVSTSAKPWFPGPFITSRSVVAVGSPPAGQPGGEIPDARLGDANMPASSDQ
jgi:hypothetical protein